MTADPAEPRPRPAPGDLFGAGRPAQRTGELAGFVIGQAASILEQELAAGIHAAQGLEQRFVDVPGLRSADPDQLMQRLRRDAHDIVDIVIDLVDVAVTSTGAAGRRAVSVRAPESNGTPAAEPGPKVLSLVVPDPVRPGGTTTTALVVENARSTGTGAVVFSCSDLVSASGARIPAGAVTFDPAEVSVLPQGSQRVAVLIAVPAEAPVGTYSGLLQAGGAEQVRAVLSLEVG